MRTSYATGPATGFETTGCTRPRLTVACAQAGELDRAESEGRKALATARTTGSAGATRELKRLATALG